MQRVTTSPEAGQCCLQGHTKNSQINTSIRREFACLGLAILLGVLAMHGIGTGTSAKNMHNESTESTSNTRNQFPTLLKGKGVKLGVRG